MTMRIALLFALLLGGCMHDMSFVDSGIPFVAHANVHPDQVRLCRPGDPMPAFTEIGYLEYDQLWSPGDRDPAHIQVALANEASAHGCNAIVLHDGCERVSQDRRGTHHFLRMAATCVWVDDP